MKVWKIKKGSDKRIRAAHPWVFSNELMDSPKGILAGEPVELTDLKGNFLARGYGNPHSLIAFRALSFDSHHGDPCSVESVINKLVKSWMNRKLLGFDSCFRLCFSESDFLPGLIIDRYLLVHNDKTYQVFSFQLLTAGMDLIFREWLSLFQGLVEQSLKIQLSDVIWENTIIVSRCDVAIRKLEGLEVLAPAALKTIEGIDLKSANIAIQSVWDPNQRIGFEIDLIEGQKTGFFLDQTYNMKLLIEALKPRLSLFKDKPLRMIDLCCYMGQWSAHVVYYLNAHGISVELMLVDVSDLALKKAMHNLSKIGSYLTSVRQENRTMIKNKIQYLKADVLEGLTEIPQNSYDVVISDPPAFVKNKRDIEVGLHGYMKLNQQAFRMADHNSLVISCTCSGLVAREDFINSLRKAILRSGKKAKIICEGGLGWDHPQLVQFPEGQYLQMVMSSVE
jgi:23S rRNA (cytosine1962-C5)-methyltransferase